MSEPPARRGVLRSFARIIFPGLDCLRRERYVATTAWLINDVGEQRDGVSGPSGEPPPEGAGGRRGAVDLAGSGRTARRPGGGRGSRSSRPSRALRVSPAMRSQALRANATCLTPAEETKAQRDEEVIRIGGLRDRVDAELHRAIVEPLPHLVVDLTSLEVAGERPVVPRAHTGSPAVLVAVAVVLTSDSDAHVDAEPPEENLEEHRATIERLGWIVEGAEHAGVDELVIRTQAPRCGPGGLVERLSGGLGGKTDAVAIDVPGGMGSQMLQLGRIEIQSL
jgi:hypothetical protein